MTNGDDEGGKSPAEMMKEIRQSEAFWDASVEREKAAGDRYMGGTVNYNYYAFDADRIEFLIGFGSAIVTFVLAASLILARSAGVEIPVSIQISSTIAAVFLIDWYRHAGSEEN